MRMLRIWLLAALLTGCGLQGQAADYAFLNLTGTGQSYELAAIRKITFAGDNMVLWVDGKQHEVAMNSIGKVVFSDMATAISLPHTAGPAAFELKDGTLRVATGGEVSIYTLDGRMVRQATSDGQTTISLDDLPRGAYIIKSAGTARKVVKQ